MTALTDELYRLVDIPVENFTNDPDEDHDHVKPLDVLYIVNGAREPVGVKLQMSAGPSTIWIDTLTATVTGRRGNELATINLELSTAEILSEYYIDIGPPL